MPARVPADRLAGLLDIAEDGTVTADARQDIVLFSRGAAHLFGYDPAEVVGRPLDLLIPGRFRAAHPGRVAGFGRAPGAARLVGERRGVYGVRKDGTEFPAAVSISELGSGAETRGTAIARDATERKRYEAAAREPAGPRTRARPADAGAAARRSDHRYRRIVETANEGAGGSTPAPARRSSTAAWPSSPATARTRPAVGGSGTSCPPRTGRPCRPSSSVAGPG